MKNEDNQTKRETDDAAANPDQRQPTRRQFLKGLTTGTVAIGALSQSGCARLQFRLSKPAARRIRRRSARSAESVVAKSVSTRNGEVINIEGDPSHPISEGTLCSKGARRPFRW